jgi:hypothetical protein
MRDGLARRSRNSCFAWSVVFAVSVLLAVALHPFPTAASATSSDDTWQGGSLDGQQLPWSSGANWVGGSAPTLDAGQLTFPPLDHETCGSLACFGPFNDLTGNSAEGLTIDDEYELSGNALRLGAGGITSHTVHDAFVSVPMPLVLTAPQTWRIAAGGHGKFVVGHVTADDSLPEPPSLTVHVGKSATISLDNGVDVGPLTVTGGGRAVVDSYGGAKAAVNAHDREPVTVTDGSQLYVGISGRTGRLEAEGGRVFVGGATLHTAGASFEGTSSLRINIHGRKGVPGKSFGQLEAGGVGGAHRNVHLGGATLLLTGHGSVKEPSSYGYPRSPACATMRVGESYPLLTATGSITGRFNDIPDGAVIRATCSGEPGHPLKVRIHYGRHAVTATAVTTGSNHEHPPTRTENSGRIRCVA